MQSNQIRKSFLEFFKNNGHTILPSASLVPAQDETLLFTNAGMNQFKDVFLGKGSRSYKRAADSQKCIRVSGKHNDLEDVGHDSHHHTFFEMLGNWSFGDYFKKEAISLAWELLTEVWSLPKERLWATVYKTDEESFGYWRTETDIDASHILRFGEKENFWDMGETGPCGQCSEIHIDLTKNGCNKSLVNANNPDVLELWNLVFIQYNRKKDGTMEELPSRHVDTGMGLERISRVLQNVKSNYDTDLFKPIIEDVCKISDKPYKGEYLVPIQIIVDHIRALVFAIADGVMPSNEGRGYVLRRLIRRASRRGNMIGLNQPFLYRLAGSVVNIMKDAYPELETQKEHISLILKSEEERFQRTLLQGINLFQEVVKHIKRDKKKLISGESAFKLYDTFGFPIDLTCEMAREQGLEVDTTVFDKEMNKQRQRGVDSRRVKTSDKENLSFKETTVFTGYDKYSDKAQVLYILKHGKKVSKAKQHDDIELILNKTCFYAESGGQIGDTGSISTKDCDIQVKDTYKISNTFIHKAKVSKGVIKVGDTVTASIDITRRMRIAKHHSSAHLLQHALRQVLGKHIQQAGSWVGEKRLRFDFSHFKAISNDQLNRIEKIVNQKIMELVEVKTFNTSMKKARELEAIALFNEKYGETVRVVRMGDFSMELCGGTHVGNTGEIGLFRIISDSSIASGVRRIEASCGESAYDIMKEEQEILVETSHFLRVPVSEIPGKIETLIKNHKELEKQIKKSKSKQVMTNIDDFIKKAITVDNVKLISVSLKNMGHEALRDLADALKTKLGSAVIALGSVKDNKICLVTAVTSDLVRKGLHAGKIIREIAQITGGSGGGRPDMAQAGGKDISKLAQALKHVPEIIKKFLIESR
ncbi:alanine--tRNA ligase [bacterium]|nr:alanine--tRNA ligase [bacterium]